MKKYSVLLSAAIFIWTISVQAQIRVGARAGINLSTWSLDPSVSGGKEAAILPHAGVVANMEINSHWSFQPEILFSQKGVKLADNSFGYIFKINHLEVPLLGKFSFGSEDVKGFLTAGPFIGYALSQKSVTRQDGKVIASQKVSFDEDLEDDGVADTRVDAGWALGAGAQFATGPGDLFVDVRYEYSVTGLFKYKDSPPDTKVRNKIFMISVGYLISLRKK